MLAAALSSTMQGVLFLIAVACFVVAAIPLVVGKINLVAAGLAFFAFVFMWNALAAG